MGTHPPMTQRVWMCRIRRSNLKVLRTLQHRVCGQIKMDRAKNTIATTVSADGRRRRRRRADGATCTRVSPAPHKEHTARTKQIFFRPPPRRTATMPPAGAPKRSHLGVEARSPVVACSIRRSVAVAIQLQTVSARTLSRNTKCMFCHSRFLESRMPRHKHFERRPKQRQLLRELNKMGTRAPTPQIVRKMGDKGLTPHFLPAECACTYVIPIN